jgi:hypothetical protein
MSLVMPRVQHGGGLASVACGLLDQLTVSMLPGFATGLAYQGYAGSTVA